MINEMIERIEKIDVMLGKAETAFSCTLLVLMVTVVGVGVFLRYVLKSPLVAGMNIATLMLVWLTFFGASAIYKDNGHIAIQFIMNRLPKKIRAFFLSVMFSLIGAALIVTVYQACKLVEVQWHQQIVAIGIPRSFLSLPIVIAGSFMLITTIRHLATVVRSLSGNMEN